MPSKASRWGNSIGVRLPAYVVERTGIKPGDDVVVRLLDSGDIVIRPVNEREVHSGYATDGAKPQITNKEPAAEDKW